MTDAKMLNALLEKARVAEKRRQDNTLADRAEREEERRERIKQANRLFERRLRQASIEDYKDWLAGFLEKGGKPTHYHDYPMENGLDDWKVALKNFRIVPLFGTDSLNIIIPSGIKFLGGELGHNSLYLMGDFSYVGSWVPIYSNIHF